jgi:hypothetical protein
MSYFTKNRIRNWLIIFLLVTNLATISTILYHSWQFKKMESCDTHARLRKFIDNELKFSAEQMAQLKADRKVIETRTNGFYDKFDNQRILIYNELAKPKPDTTLIDSVIMQSGVVSAGINRSSVLRYYSLFNICTAQQKEKLSVFFKNMANDVAKEMKEENSNEDDE